MSEADLPPCTRASLYVLRTGQLPHASWDLNVGDGTSWLRALQICNDCPFIGWCTEERADHRRLQNSNPQDVIWAGVAYNRLGNPMTVQDLRLRATLTARREARQRRNLAEGEQAAG
ncbi:MAG: hypothetical protein ACR2P2_11720 [Nakamurella sp.]